MWTLKIWQNSFDFSRFLCLQISNIQHGQWGIPHRFCSCDSLSAYYEREYVFSLSLSVIYMLSFRTDDELMKNQYYILFNETHKIHQFKHEMKIHNIASHWIIYSL